MNIEQIAKESRLSMLRDFNGLSKEINICVKDDTEFLRRCLKKLAEQDVDPVGYFFQHEDTGQMMSVDVQQVEWGFEKNNPRLINCGKLYTETQLLAAQQRTAEACAKVCSKEAWAADAMDAIRDGHWREYL